MKKKMIRSNTDQGHMDKAKWGIIEHGRQGWVEQSEQYREKGDNYT